MESFDNDMKLDNTELLEAQAHVWNHIFNFINSYSLKCAVELNIPDIIHKHSKPMSLTQLISSLPIHPSKSQSIHRLMRILIHSGFFTTQKTNENEQGYVLTNASKLLLKDNPLSVTPFLLAMLDPALVKPWDGLSTWFGKENPIITPYETAHGMIFWEHMELEPSLNSLFNEAMASDARLVTSVVIEKCRDVFEGVRTLVDVGGGTGTVAKAFAKAFSGLECTVLDLPHVVADLQTEGNVKYVGGDMFDAVPPADAIFLKWILHDWNDEECMRILKKCKEAITYNGKMGKVIIVDMIVEDNNENDGSLETKFFFDMVMLILTTGKERNKKEWSRLFFEAGFSNFKITSILGLRSMIEIFP